MIMVVREEFTVFVWTPISHQLFAREQNKNRAKDGDFFPTDFFSELLGYSAILFLVDWAKTKTYFAYFAFSLSKHS